MVTSVEILPVTGRRTLHDGVYFASVSSAFLPGIRNQTLQRKGLEEGSEQDKTASTSKPLAFSNTTREFSDAVTHAKNSFLYKTCSSLRRMREFG